MIVVRAPLRISFVGGGTDLPDFYRRFGGRVVSTTIDKYIYVAVKETPFLDKVSVRHAHIETVDHPKELGHTRIKAALLDAGIDKNIEITSFATLPAKTGLGSSSSFSVALIKGLGLYQGKDLNSYEVAEAASRLEIELVGEPIGKQDQYAAAFGGLNVYDFNQDDSVTVTPVHVSAKRLQEFERHIMVFFTSITRFASQVLTEQKSNVYKNADTLQELARLVTEFTERLTHGDWKEMGDMLHATWLKKKTLSSNISNGVLDELYQAGIDHGAWGGKVLGAGGGGCLLFLVPPEKQKSVRAATEAVAVQQNLVGFRELPIRFAPSGAEVVFQET